MTVTVFSKAILGINTGQVGVGLVENNDVITELVVSGKD